ncbi:prenyltransferase [Corynebacterium cystitidis]|uniref:4-hydroxybenzoate polyprenyltransferase n=1 Tax=Corynebacterium cystitidis DSM 20524 TaxID=1121357 RepID=A0A1H9U5L8_9CORY|nr:prenyltransferase [Corynebacterium cystitidis]WJY81182.1 prenyltransferase [Corynebacterium cystitidis DSM 20524]SES04622.1 4-hydroxybenzoate polyprenyltransferase [Corynebacterium cystitidis DSM 20524]SNV89610.1 prenyltransferase [Corynebacterium cystitidis]
MSLFGTILAASRPISWINTAFPFAAAYLLVGGGFTWQLIVGTLFFLIPYNIAIYGINDVFDYESDLRNPRKGGIEGSVLHPKWHKPVLWASVITTVPFLVVLVIGGTWMSTAWLAVSMFSVVAYSVAGLRFKEKPVLDSVTSSAHFTTPALVGATMVVPTPGLVFWGAIGAFFLWGMASHAFGAVQDITADRQAGLSSIATELGARTVTRLTVVLYAAASALLLFLPFPGWIISLVGLGYVANAARFWNVTDVKCEVTRKGWRVFLWLNYVVGAIVTIALLAALAG